MHRTKNNLQFCSRESVLSLTITLEMEKRKQKKSGNKNYIVPFKILSASQYLKVQKMVFPLLPSSNVFATAYDQAVSCNDCETGE